MSFANTYLKRYSSGSNAVLKPPDPDLFFIIVIPVFDEEYILDCLKSIVGAEYANFPIEIILVINHHEEARISQIHQNELTKVEVLKWAVENCTDKIKIHQICPPVFKKAKAGPGLARKIGMDTAIDRFNDLNRPNGVIVSMDADTLVDRNYFIALSRLYESQKKVNACTVYFEHLKTYGGQFIENIEAMMDYEIYLRMVKVGLNWVGYPLAIHTLGSAFSFRASSYVKAGGMGTQQSGEDFYFLHKCIQLGDFWEAKD